ncbi:Putative ovule protein [Arachis hypogaea]|nr:Putative ovule protein [Arachis hypogaea]
MPVVAVLSNKNKMRVPFELKQGQSRIFHKLPSGLSIEGWCTSATWCETVTTDDTKSDDDLDCETGDERGRELQCDATVLPLLFCLATDFDALEPTTFHIYHKWTFKARKIAAIEKEDAVCRRCWLANSKRVEELGLHEGAMILR